MAHTWAVTCHGGRDDHAGVHISLPLAWERERDNIFDLMSLLHMQSVPHNLLSSE